MGHEIESPRTPSPVGMGRHAGRPSPLLVARQIAADPGCLAETATASFNVASYPYAADRVSN
jgi:hypothetical protein